MTLARRPLLAAALALPALRRAPAQAAQRAALLHLNDFHARHDGAQDSGAGCRIQSPCLGGSPRLVAAMKAARAAAEEAGRATLTLDAGDQFMGSLYHTVHRGAAEAAMLALSGCQAMAPGNHEFNLGPEALAAFARAIPAPILAANLDTRDEPALHGLVRPWVAWRRGALRIAVIGLATEETPFLSSPGPRLRFAAPEEDVARAIAEIRAEGPATILLLSHRGLGRDREMAARLPGVDVIIGGHSHSLLADRPDAAGPHPLVLDGPDRPVRIVQAGALGRFLGRLDLDIGADGRVLAHGGQVRELTPDLPEDEAARATLARFATGLEEVRRRPVAQLPAALPHAGCRDGECALGNLVADAMLAAVPGAEVALMNGGGLRAALPAGVVTLGDLLTTLPFGNTLATLRLRGADLLAALEGGLSRPGAGRFPQVAGLRLVWDPAAPPGDRLREVRVRGEALDPARAYLVVTNDFLRRGGDGYMVLRDRAIGAYDGGPLLEEVVSAHLAGAGMAVASLEGRIVSR